VVEVEKQKSARPTAVEHWDDESETRTREETAGAAILVTIGSPPGIHSWLKENIDH